jgi:hypothetical protein
MPVDGVERLLRLHALRYHRQAEPVRERHSQADDVVVGVTRAEAGGERTVELDGVDRQQLGVVEDGVARQRGAPTALDPGS